LWRNFRKGYKKRIAKSIANGDLPSQGSDKLSFDGYKSLCKLAVSSNYIYAHGYLTLAWNLMTRSSTTTMLKFSLISWDTDHITINIPWHKGDNTGELGPTIRSLYANPYVPSI
jgi:hypothetical protein